MLDESLLEHVTAVRAEEAIEEVRRVYPDAAVSFEVRGGRGIITVCQDRFIVSKEFVETDASLEAPGRMVEYARVLLGKSRLVVVVPRDRAVGMWLRLLELNNYWLFYHQLYCFDQDGSLERVDRHAWRRMRGLPPERRERAPEIV